MIITHLHRHTRRRSLLQTLIATACMLLLTACSTQTFVDESITIKENLTLDADVTKTNYLVNGPGVVIEGNGHVIDGDCNTECIGLVINADNVTVRNLTITRFDGGVTINPQVTGTRFENVRVHNNVNHGIFVNVGASDFRCDFCDVSDNGTTGIYLEYNSFGNTISNSRIANNGYRDKDTGDWQENLINDQKDKREGIAVDSSQSNIIRNSVFEGNALTGVTMYRNCGERGVIREWGANYNSILDSTFSDGIHIASRQEKDLSSWTCLEPYVYDGKFITDEAEYNRIERVTLGNNASIIIQDDNNSVRSVTGGTIIFASEIREALGQPLLTFDAADNDAPLITSLSNIPANITGVSGIDSVSRNTTRTYSDR